MSVRRYDVSVIGGFGHVGLPFGLVLADAGMQVALYDIDVAKRASLLAGRMPFMEEGAEPILKRVLGRTLHVVDSLAEAARADIMVMTIGTPVDEYLNPQTKPILQLAEQLATHLRSGQCLILRSTVFPGTSRNLHEFFASRRLRLHIACCPERIVQGHAVEELRSLPQLVSGLTDEAVRRAEALFRRLGVTVVPLTVEEAELAKLFSNAWRYIQFATANQFYMIAVERGADPARVYHAMTYQYERGRHIPRPGFAAGPCLLKDTLQLAAFYRNHFQLGYAAMMINEGFPNFLVTHLAQQVGGTLRGKRVGILGMAFKADSDDTRDSLSYKLAKILRFHGAEVVCSDEYVRDAHFITKDALVQTCPIVIVGVPHRAYQTLMVPASTVLIDVWGVIPHDGALRAGVASASAPPTRARSRGRRLVKSGGAER